MPCAVYEEGLHDAACKEVGIEGQPQGVVGGHQMGHGLAQGEKDASGSKHAQQHLARPIRQTRKKNRISLRPKSICKSYCDRSGSGNCVRMMITTQRGRMLS